MDEVEKHSQLFKALSDPTRLKLVRMLGRCSPDVCGPAADGAKALCVGALAHRLEVTQSAVSQHLRVLREAGLVRRERRGSFVHYTLDPDGLERLEGALRETLAPDS
jgi:ArsR family transcriptional regulator